MAVDPNTGLFLFDGHATGALWQPPDYRNYQLQRLPGVREMLRVGYPAEHMANEEHLAHVYNQGAIPSCVWHSIAGLQTANEHKERNGEVIVFDAPAMHASTGPVNQGRWPQEMLKVAQDQGTKVVGSNKRYRVGSYAFAPTNQGPQAFVDTLKAALAAGHICCIATRLWSGFGWETSGQLLGWESYHEWVVWGYRSTPGVYGSVAGQNSWGTGFGRAGKMWVPLDLILMENFQGGAVICNTVIDAVDDDLSPNPPTPTPTPNPPTPTPPPNDWEREIIRLVNQHRQSKGLTLLKEHPALMQSSGAKSRDMGVNGYFAHEHNGKGPLQWMTEAGIQNPVVWGENIAAGQPDPSATMPQPAGGYIELSAMRNGAVLDRCDRGAESTSPGGAFTAWMNSPGHRANIEFPGFTHIGVGHELITPSQYAHYWTQHFAGLPDGQPTPTPDPPTPEPEPAPPTPEPTPPPDPARLFVTGALTGEGLEFVREGMSLEASGSGFRGRLEVQTLNRPTPDPDPGPTPNPPDPTPDPPLPTPSDLQVQVRTKRPFRGTATVSAQAFGVGLEGQQGEAVCTVAGVEKWRLPIVIGAGYVGQLVNKVSSGDPVRVTVTVGGATGTGEAAIL